MAHRMASVLVTLNDLEGHSPVAGKAFSSTVRWTFYQISTDSVLMRSLSGSWTSCLASLRPFIKILWSLVTAWCFASILSAGCVLYLCESAVFFFPALILTEVQNFLATIWPLVEILRFLVIYVNCHNKDSRKKTPCNWLCSDDAAFVKLLWPLISC